MAQPIWRKIVSELTVPEAGQQWKLAVDVLTAGKLMLVQVVEDAGRNPPVTGRWTPHGFSAACSADGDFTGQLQGTSPSGTLLVTAAPAGALIARIGGSTADQTVDPPPTASATPSRIAFSIGRRCVFTAPAAPIGSLFLGVNDIPARMALVQGSLLVDIFEAI